MEKLNEYNQILDAICMYLHDSIVDTNDEVISVFEFIRIMNKYIYPFPELRENNKYLTNTINQDLKNSINNTNYSIDKKKYLKHFVIDGFDLIPTKELTYMDIYMHRTRGLKHSHHYEARVIKNDQDKVEVLAVSPYYTTNESGIKTIISLCEDYIKDTIDFSEKYRVFITELLKRIKIDNDLFDVSILYNEYGFRAAVGPNIDTIDSNVYYAKYYEEKPLTHVVQENHDLLLWSIPIQRKSLPAFANDLINKELESEVVLKRTK